MNGSNSLGAIHATMTYKEGMPKDQNLEKKYRVHFGAGNSTPRAQTLFPIGSNS
jgi:hypothetical protein